MHRTPCALLLAASLAALAGLLGPAAGADEPRDAAAPPDVPALVAGLASPDREQRQAAAEAAREVAHPDVLPALLKAAKDEYRSVREPVWKALATRAATPEKAKAARALEARLRELDRKPDSPEELSIVVQALHDLAQRSSIEPLLEGIEPTTEAPVALARLKAVGNVPAREAIDALINYASRGRGGDTHRGAARQALTYATGLKLANLDAWLRWWNDARRTWDPEEAAADRAEQAAKAGDREATRDARRKAASGTKPKG
ncbi:MAG: HEAT repeat domain-containing protein, partial [Planctomycetia bacterium]